jgi:O-succinylhomoserine sulfhydrylase
MDRGGNLIAFEVVGGKKAAFAFMNKLKIVDISNNLGDAKTLITHPASTTHSNIDPDEQQKLDITQGMLRISVGLEDADDLVQDIRQALS